ncbi:hypothetical protein JTE90_002558 [Oedothorax gibbosus]|uniref:Uncharacterized protein n=1 Tax=Oedothorax gibbosus TaxID=931172 RepID=A0AAV6V2F5_9ARAC|nr:hypothetical protein JTE90_002558 [Oedothorax gibbosus]
MLYIGFDQHRRKAMEFRGEINWAVEFQNIESPVSDVLNDDDVDISSHGDIMADECIDIPDDADVLTAKTNLQPGTVVDESSVLLYVSTVYFIATVDHKKLLLGFLLRLPNHPRVGFLRKMT